ncbi:MAG: preprotein translocase subunit SecG [candidate division WOR-3 bacterium]
MTWFYFILLILFLLMVIILTGVVLLQEPKTGGLAASLSGGGGLESFLGARGAPTFFMKATWVMGGLYMALSLVLSLLSARTIQGSTTIEREVKSGELYKKLAPLTPGTEERK